MNKDKRRILSVHISKSTNGVRAQNINLDIQCLHRRHNNMAYYM